MLIRATLLAVFAVFLSGCIASDEILFTSRDVEVPFTQANFTVHTMNSNGEIYNVIRVSREGGAYTLRAEKKIDNATEGYAAFIRFDEPNYYILAYTEGSNYQYHLARIEGNRILVWTIGVELQALARKAFDAEPNVSSNPFANLDAGRTGQVASLLRPYRQQILDSSAFVPARSLEQVRDYHRAWMLADSDKPTPILHIVQ